MDRYIEAVIDSFASEGYSLYPESILEKEGKRYFLVKNGLKKYLASDDSQFERPVKKVSIYNIYERTRGNAIKLRNLFRHLVPVACGIKRSFGFGDRLGVATPGHIDALGGNIFPVFAQQSIREMERTGRIMEDVLDDAMWGVFQKGYKNGYGADIDHVKNTEDVSKACECGYTMYTIDPSDYVRDDVRDISRDEINYRYNTIPDRAIYGNLYQGKEYRIDSTIYKMDEFEFTRIAVTYEKALKHIVKCFNIIKERIHSRFDFEASVDETSTPTTPLAHIFIVEELRRNNIEFTSLALRFIGEFEKGIDYRGDMKLFKEQFHAHAAICRSYGRYKLSIHSGSDKFSIYPVIGKESGGVFHIKTAGTSWLEAARLISHKAPSLYRRMHKLALDNFEKDRKSYHITAELSGIPDIAKISDTKLPELLNENNCRQLIHITYGSILKEMRKEIYAILNRCEEEYYMMLKRHLGRHLEMVRG